MLILIFTASNYPKFKRLLAAYRLKFKLSLEFETIPKYHKLSTQCFCRPVSGQIDLYCPLLPSA